MWVSQGYLSFPPLANLHYHREHVTRENVQVSVTAGTIFFLFLLSLPRSELMCPHHRGGRDYGPHASPPISRSRPHALPLPRWPPAISLLPLDWNALRAVLTQLTEFSTSWKTPCWESGGQQKHSTGDASCKSLKKLLRGKIIMTTRSKKEKERWWFSWWDLSFFSFGCHTD